jgi:hypothetical protein
MKVISRFDWDVRSRRAPHQRSGGSILTSTIAQGLRTTYDATLTESLPPDLAVFVERLGQPKPDEIRVASDG